MSGLYLMVRRNVHKDPAMKYVGWISTDCTAGGLVCPGQMRSATVTGQDAAVYATIRGTLWPKMLEVILYDGGCEHRAVLTDKDVGHDAIRLKFRATPLKAIDCRDVREPAV